VPHVFLRPGQLQRAKWDEIDFAEKVWRVPAERMKMKKPDAVPLSRQVLFILRDLRLLARTSEYLFPASTRRSGRFQITP
jgi:integrase